MMQHKFESIGFHSGAGEALILVGLDISIHEEETTVLS